MREAWILVEVDEEISLEMPEQFIRPMIPWRYQQLGWESAHKTYKCIGDVWIKSMDIKHSSQIILTIATPAICHHQDKDS